MKRILNMLGIAPGEQLAAAPQSLVVPPAREFVNQPALDAASRRIGMWVMTAEGVGILTGCRVDGLAVVTLAKPDGGTRMTLDANDQAVPATVVCELGRLRTAYIFEIPESRRGDPDRLAAFGYSNGGA
jgi:hypothetical protein